MFQNKLNTQIGSQWRNEAEQLEVQQVQRNVCFSCLGTFAHNMCDFGMETEKVMAFVKKISSINELSQEHQSMLLAMPCLRSASSSSSSSSSTSSVIVLSRNEQVSPPDMGITSERTSAQTFPPSSSDLGTNVQTLKDFLNN